MRHSPRSIHRHHLIFGPVRLYLRAICAARDGFDAISLFIPRGDGLHICHGHWKFLWIPYLPIRNEPNDAGATIPFHLPQIPSKTKGTQTCTGNQRHPFHLDSECPCALLLRPGTSQRLTILLPLPASNTPTARSNGHSPTRTTRIDATLHHPPIRSHAHTRILLVPRSDHPSKQPPPEYEQQQHERRHHGMGRAFTFVRPTPTGQENGRSVQSMGSRMEAKHYCRSWIGRY
jgi:hypothetical protein